MYNPGTNDAFLVRYGFVERGNPHDVVEAPALLQRIRAAEIVPHSRFQRLRDLGFEDTLLQASASQRCVIRMACPIADEDAKTGTAD